MDESQRASILARESYLTQIRAIEAYIAWRWRVHREYDYAAKGQIVVLKRAIVAEARAA